MVEDAGRRVVSVVGDVRDGATMSSAVEQGLEAFGQIDIVGANAGISTYGSLWETSQEEWDEALDVNLTGVWQTLRAAVPSMIERERGGSMTVTSSCAGLRGFGYASAYTATSTPSSASCAVLPRSSRPTASVPTWSARSAWRPR